MPDVRLKFQPGNVVTVSAQEFTDLDRQGLVLEVVSPASAQPTKTVPVKTVSATAEHKPAAKPSAGDK